MPVPEDARGKRAILFAGVVRSGKGLTVQANMSGSKGITLYTAGTPNG